MMTEERHTLQNKLMRVGGLGGGGGGNMNGRKGMVLGVGGRMR